MRKRWRPGRESSRLIQNIWSPEVHLRTVSIQYILQKFTLRNVFVLIKNIWIEICLEELMLDALVVKVLLLQLSIAKRNYYCCVIRDRQQSLSSNRIGEPWIEHLEHGHELSLGPHWGPTRRTEFLWRIEAGQSHIRERYYLPASSGSAVRVSIFAYIWYGDKLRSERECEVISACLETKKRLHGHKNEARTQSE